MGQKELTDFPEVNALTMKNQILSGKRPLLHVIAHLS